MFICPINRTEILEVVINFVIYRIFVFQHPGQRSCLVWCCTAWIACFLLQWLHDCLSPTRTTTRTTAPAVCSSSLKTEYMEEEMPGMTTSSSRDISQQRSTRFRGGQRASGGVSRFQRASTGVYGVCDWLSPFNAAYMRYIPCEIYIHMYIHIEDS